MFIWVDSNGEGRNRYVMFRRSFKLDAVPSNSELHLFADSVYALYVNGRYVNYGPIRFDPRYPLYDTFDLTPYLNVGENVVAVLVNHFGCITFRSIPAGGGLIAWGEAGPHSFATGSGLWKAKRSTAYDEMAPKGSFALQPIEIVDQRKEPEDWHDVDFDDHDWDPAVVLEKQDAWGELSPRSIPFMQQEPAPIQRILGVYSLQKAEDLYSFRVPAHFWYDYHWDMGNKKRQQIVTFRSWIYSPCEQEVSLALFWGEHWINGQELVEPLHNYDIRQRQEYAVALKKGWNRFFGKAKVYFDEFSFYMGLPVGKGLTVSSDKQMESDGVFEYSSLIREDAFEAHVARRGLPFPDDEKLDDFGGWQRQVRDAYPHNPVRDIRWEQYDTSDTLEVSQLATGVMFPLSAYPNGFSIHIDLGCTRLVKPVIELSGAKGAIIDVGYSEEEQENRIKLYPSHQYHPATRAVAAGDRFKWIPFYPHGARYVNLTVRNPSRDIQVTSLNFVDVGYPVESKGAFQCSDPLLNDIWKMCRQTQKTDMEDAYDDCTGRERGMYSRDTIIQYHNNLVCFGDHSLMKRCLELYGQSAVPDGRFRCCYPIQAEYTISDFCLNTVEGFYNYYAMSGDLSVIREYWGAIKENLAWFESLSDEREDQLLDCEWHLKRGEFSRYGGFHGDNEVGPDVQINKGASCFFTCMYYTALRSAEAMAGRLEDAAALKRYSARAQELADRIHDGFWDREKQCYADNLEKLSHSVHASLLAARAGLIPEERQDAVRDHLICKLKSIFVNGRNPDQGVKFGASMAFYIFEGLYALGMSRTAESLMREGWGWMLDEGLTTCREFLGKTEACSHCHAWSASPMYYLSTRALGIQFPEPGNIDLIAINVQADSIEWAEGSYPHPRGAIRIKWSRDADNRIVVDELDVPPGVDVISAI